MNPYRDQHISSSISYNDYGIDKYMKMVDDELIKNGHRLSDSLFISQLSALVDTLSSNNFNKTLFNHILDFSNLDITKPIKLLDFFRGFFSVYETMKNNCTGKQNENLRLKGKKESLQEKIPSIIKEEKIEANGLSTLSCLKIILKYAKDAKGNADKHIFSFVLIGDKNNKHEIDPTNSIDLVHKLSIPLNDMNKINNGLKVIADNTKEIATFTIPSLLEEPKTISYGQYSIHLLWINSKLSYINKQINDIDKLTASNNECISIMNTSIKQLESCFKTYFDEENKANNENKQLPMLNSELIVSEAIEKVVLKIVGRDIIIWDKIVFSLNRIILPLIILCFFRRTDFLSLLLCFLLFGIEYEIVKRKTLERILFFLFITLGVDLVWLLYYFLNWNIQIELDGPIIGTGIRKIVVIITLVIDVMKVVIGFALWKMGLEYKMYKINNIVLNDNDNNVFRKNSSRPRICEAPSPVNSSLVENLNVDFLDI